MRITVQARQIPLARELHAAWGSASRRDLVMLAIEDEAGLVGYGEAAPLPDYDGVDAGAVLAALEDCLPPLRRATQFDRSELIAECAALAAVPQALAAIDTALWDLEGKRLGQPVARLLGAGADGSVAVNYTMAAADRAGAAAQAAVARQAGYGCVKVKVAIGDDAGRVAAVRAAAGPQMAIRLDANGGWTVPEAGAALKVLAPAVIELCEEPVHGIAAIEELAGEVPVPLAIDETASDPGALDHRACDAVCLKLSRCGGITGLLDAARRARRAGYEIYLASTLDGPLGIAAALHAAVALAPERPCGLATLVLFGRPVPALTPEGGRMTLPPGAGLGDGLQRWYA